MQQYEIPEEREGQFDEGRQKRLQEVGVKALSEPEEKIRETIASLLAVEE